MNRPAATKLSVSGISLLFKSGQAFRQIMCHFPASLVALIAVFRQCLFQNCSTIISSKF